MDIDPFMRAISALGAEPGLRLAPIAPGVPEYTLALGPFAAELRVGFDLDPSAGLVPEVVLDIVVGCVGDRWSVFDAWESAPRAAMVEHGLPVPLPRPDITFASDGAVGIAYRCPLPSFSTGTALQLLHAGAAYASFMARDLAPQLSAEARDYLAHHGIEPGRPVPFPSAILQAADTGRAA